MQKKIHCTEFYFPYKKKEIHLDKRHVHFEKKFNVFLVQRILWDINNDINISRFKKHSQGIPKRGSQQSLYQFDSKIANLPFF